MAAEATAPAPIVATIDDALALKSVPDKARAALENARTEFLELIAAADALADEPEHVEEAIDTPADAPLNVKLAHAMAEAGRVIKARTANTGGSGTYKFAGAEAILAAVRAPLFRRGVTLLPDLEGAIEHKITSSNGNEGTRLVIDVAFEFSDGERTIVKRWKGEGQDYGDKAFGKAFTNAIKTFVRTAWLLPTEHDDPEASPSGDRRGSNAATVEVAPAWARPLDATPAARELKLSAIAALEQIVGHRATAVACAGRLAERADGMPAGVAAWLASLPQWIEAGAAAARGTVAAEQDAAAEAPDTPAPEPVDVAPVDVAPAAQEAEATPAPAEEAPAEADATTPAPEPVEAPPPPEGYDRWPTGDDFVEAWAAKRLEAGEQAGMKDAHAALHAAGCKCPDPLGIRGRRIVDDACPFLDHGIPF